MQAELAPFHRPDRSLIVAGISRSGTSLLSVLLNALDNVVCFNEVLPLEPARLPEAFARARRDLLTGRPVRNKYDAVGRLTTDTLSAAEKRRAVVDKRLDDDLCVASKRNLPYLDAAEELLDLGYCMVVMVRHPVYTLGSWGSPKAEAGGIPGARIGPGDTHPHWRPVPFTRADVVERRAEAWQHHAARIWALRDRIHLVPYEVLCARPVEILAGICRFAGLPRPGPLPDIVGPTCNDDARYPDLQRVRAAVAALCPARLHFGYE